MALSVLLHLFIGAISDDLVRSRSGVDGERKAMLTARLQILAMRERRAVKDISSPPLLGKRVIESRQQQPVASSVFADSKPSISMNATGLPGVSEFAAIDGVRSHGQPEKVGAFAHDDAVNPDGVRQYRLSLGREARSYRHRLPRLAREGMVVVVVTTVRGIATPQVSLSESSNQEVLDTAAMEIVEQSVRTAVLPESLYGKAFALTVPIRFSLED